MLHCVYCLLYTLVNMDPTKSFENQILEIIRSRKSPTPKEISDILHISKRTLFKHLKRLQTNNRIIKIGSSPKVFYRYVGTTKQEEKIKPSDKSKNDFKVIVEI